MTTSNTYMHQVASELRHHHVRHTLFLLYMIVVIPTTCLLTMWYFSTYVGWISHGELETHTSTFGVKALSILFGGASLICGLGALFRHVWACMATRTFLFLSIFYPVGMYLLQMKHLHWHYHAPFSGFMWVAVPAAINGILWYLHTRTEHYMEPEYCRRCRNK